jgi:Flp pilus assembly CpaF family ATPase
LKLYAVKEKEENEWNTRKTMTANGPTKKERKARCIQEIEVYIYMYMYMYILNYGVLL